MPQVTLKSAPRGYSATKVFEKNGLRVSLGQANGFGDDTKVAITSLDEWDISVVGGDEFREAVEQILQGEGTRAPKLQMASIKFICLQFAENPEEFISFIASLKSSIYHDAERNVKRDIKLAAGKLMGKLGLFNVSELVWGEET